MIQTEIWVPKRENPSQMEYAGQRTAYEVFAELRYHLESIGCLPDEYFLLDDQWQDGVDFPRDARVICDVNYGASEGIYLDIYLKVYDADSNKESTLSFLTGKILGESGHDLDRTYLIASAVMKAFHADGGHSRFLSMGPPEQEEGVVLHLSGEEKLLLAEALASQRSHRLAEVAESEHLLRRMVGSITGFIDLVGSRPLEPGDIDTAVLAIRDGNLDAVQAALSRLSRNEMNELLPQAAGRAGQVGMRMTEQLVKLLRHVPTDTYQAACQNAVDTGDLERVKLLLDKAGWCTEEHEPGLAGEVLLHTLGHNNESRRGVSMAKTLVEHCASYQISAANPRLLYIAAFPGDLQLLRGLVEKGLDTNTCAADLIRELGIKGNGWFAPHLVKAGMKVDTQNYAALQACVRARNIDMGKLLLDSGMDFGEFENRIGERNDMREDETYTELRAYWQQLDVPDQTQEQAADEPQL